MQQIRVTVGTIDIGMEIVKQIIEAVNMHGKFMKLNPLNRGMCDKNKTYDIFKLLRIAVFSYLRIQDNNNQTQSFYDTEYLKNNSEFERFAKHLKTIPNYGFELSVINDKILKITVAYDYLLPQRNNNKYNINNKTIVWDIDETLIKLIVPQKASKENKQKQV